MAITNPKYVTNAETIRSVQTSKDDNDNDDVVATVSKSDAVNGASSNSPVAIIIDVDMDIECEQKSVISVAVAVAVGGDINDACNDADADAVGGKIVVVVESTEAANV